jgi:hypothetical protein
MIKIAKFIQICLIFKGVRITIGLEYLEKLGPFFTFFFLLLFLIHLFTCVYIVWVISPHCSPALPSHPFPTSLPGRTCSALISNFVEEKM